MDDLKLLQPPPLILSGDVAGNWEKFHQRLLLYLQATAKDTAASKVKIAILLTVGGSEAIELYNTLVFADTDYEGDVADGLLKFASVVSKFKEHCDPRKNETYERYIFRSRVQATHEPIHQFITDIKVKAKSCNFAGLHDGIIRDQIVIGVVDAKLKERLLREVDLTLLKAEQLCRAAEASQKQMDMLTSSVRTMAVATNHIDEMKTSDNYYSRGSNSVVTHTNFECRKCGRKHTFNNCPAYGKTCFQCRGKNHFSNCCRKSIPNYRNRGDNQRKINTVSTVDNMKDDDDFFIHVLTDFSPEHSISAPKDDSRLEWLVYLLLNNNFIEFKVDSGAQVNCISEQIYKTLTPRPKLIPNRTATLRTYNKDIIPSLGMCVGQVHLDNKWEDILFMVTKGDSQPILGLGTSLRFGFLDIPQNGSHSLKVQAVTSTGHTSQEVVTPALPDLGLEMKHKFPQVFAGLGRFNEPYKIRLQEDYRPVIQPVRKVPLAYRDKIEIELDRMENLGVISKVTVPTEFVNSFVVVKKKGSDEIRLCLDPRDLNKSIMREHYPMKTREQILAELGSPKYFTELDLRHAYWQIPLDEESRLFTTFGTSKGRYCFNVAPFGLNSISEACQRRVEQHITEGLRGAFPYQDNIIIVGTSIQDHDTQVAKVFEKLKSAKVTLNYEKCKFRQTSIKFLGEKLSDKGIEPDPDKIGTIQNWDRPHDEQTLKSFFGMLNFVGRFIPNLASRTPALRSLLKKEAVWLWDENHDKEFQDMKSAMITHPVLSFYDPVKQHKISNDASKDGIGSVLLQLETDGWHPVHYGARSLTKVEKSYAPIEREALGILFGATKFHQYIFGKNFLMETDHRPLVSIFEGYLNAAPARIQCIMLKLQKYDFQLTWVPRKYIMLADSLSKRVPQSNSDQTNEISDVLDLYVNEVREQIPVSDEIWDKLRQETLCDPVLSSLKQDIEQGTLKGHFRSLGGRLHIMKGVLFYSHRIFVPSSMRTEMITRVHEGHLGIEKNKRRARMCIYWPGMNKDIEDVVNACDTCCKFRDKIRREPLIQDIQDHPWHKLGIDIFTLARKDYLIVVDYMSNYPEIAPLSGKDIQCVIKALKPIFARHGIPSEITSDNVPFTSYDFLNFSRHYGFKYSPISPRDSNANGKAEMGVKIVKKLLTKAYDSGGDPYLALLNYRASPLECGKSPAQLLMGRNVRTRLPMILKDKPDKVIQDKIAKLRHRQKINYDKGTKPLEPLNPGNTVRILQDKGPAMKGQVIDSPTTRSYRVRTENDRVWRRNRNFLIKTPEQFRTVRDYTDLQIPTSESTNNISHNLGHQRNLTLGHQRNININHRDVCNSPGRVHTSIEHHLSQDIVHDNHNNGTHVTQNNNSNRVTQNNDDNHHYDSNTPDNDSHTCSTSPSPVKVVQPRKSTRVKHTPQWFKDYQVNTIMFTELN